MSTTVKIISLLFLTTVSVRVVTAQCAEPAEYLNDVRQELMKQWPQNRTVNFVFHGHSVPSGYAKTPIVNTLDAYPHQFLVLVKEHYPYAVVNSIVTAIGGENAERGAQRFESDVLSLKPDVIFIDYGLNDRCIGVDRAEKAWRSMIELAMAKNVKIVLCTPTPDLSANMLSADDPLTRQTEMIRSLAAEYHIGLADFYGAFCRILSEGKDLLDYMAQVNHPNASGHKIAVLELVPWIVPVETDKKIY